MLSIKIEKINGSNSKYQVTFNYQPLIAGKMVVFLAGDFNDYRDNEIQMKEDNGIYTVTLELKEGKYAYKFIVDNQWLNDQNAEEFVADGFGGFNSFISVGDLDALNSLYLINFLYKSTDSTLEVFLAGDFNDWQGHRDRLLYNQQKQQYQLTVPLRLGTYQYKFVVNSNWIHDENAQEFLDDGLGGQNSLVSIDSNFLRYSPDYQDFLSYGIISDDPTYYLNQKSLEDFEIRIKTYKGNCNKLYVNLNDKFHQLEKQDSNHYFDYYVFHFSSGENLFNYYFVIERDSKSFFICPGFYTDDKKNIRFFTYDREDHQPFLTPDWVKDGIIYQIFVDRFCNGDQSINQDFKEDYYLGKNSPPQKGSLLKKDSEYFHFVDDWYDHSGLKNNPYIEGNVPDTNSFYGGDFAGIIEKLDYLTDLGITIIYLNPVFEAPSNHKYDAADYLKPDPHFGSIETFKTLVTKAHTKGIKIIIDVAFNHTGDAFFAFLDSKAKGPDSLYYHWYEWKKWPIPENENYIPSDYYNCWWGFGHMPDLDFDKSRFSPYENGVKNIVEAEPNWDVINYIYSVIDFWVGDLDIDGFRLDVPNEVPYWFWKLFRDKIKSIKPDSYLVGEIWHDAKEWIGENAFDAIMNYSGFKDPVMQFFNLGTCNAEEFDKYLKAGLMLNPPQANQVMMNLLDGHDTHRFLEIAKGDLKKLKLAILFQMTFVGAPHIWYGDEIGMMGAHDPDCRRPFNWKYQEDEEAVQLLEYYKNLIKIRKSNNCLRSENYKTIIAQGSLLAYKRWNNDQSIWIVINNSDKDLNINLELDSDKKIIEDLLSDQKFPNHDHLIKINISPFSGRILI